MTRREKEYLDGWKRCKADFENFKKEVEKKVKADKDKSKIEILAKVLPVIDGLNMVIKGLENSLSLQEVQTKKFDPEIHEALAGKGDKIAEVLEKGYILNNRLIRPAKVRLKL